jgi:hypothetical protein
MAPLFAAMRESLRQRLALATLKELQWLLTGVFMSLMAIAIEFGKWIPKASSPHSPEQEQGVTAEMAGLPPIGVAIGPDGSFYINDWGNNRIRKVGLDGIITTVAGNGSGGCSGDGGPAIEASIGSSYYGGAYDVAIGPDNSIYIIDYLCQRVRKVGTDGIINTVAGGGSLFGSQIGDGVPATEAFLSGLGKITVGPDGSFYFTDHHRIMKVSPDGILTRFAGVCLTTFCNSYGIDTGYSGDGGLAIEAKLDLPSGLAVGPDGSIYFADTYNYRIRRIGPDGIITTVVGNGLNGYSGDGGLATEAMISQVFWIAVGPDGSIFITDADNRRIRRIGN